MGFSQLPGVWDLDLLAKIFWPKLVCMFASLADISFSFIPCTLKSNHSKSCQQTNLIIPGNSEGPKLQGAKHNHVYTCSLQ